jgi:hypothetical protein
LNKVYRAYISDSEAKWFNEYLKNDQNVDVWLSMRQNHLNKTAQYKYIAEFRAIDLNQFEIDKKNFAQHGVELQVLIEDLDKDTIRVFKKIRRQADNFDYDSIAGQYVSHERVNFIKLN